MREPSAWARSVVINRLRRGDLLEGACGIAALLIMLAIGMSAWLAVPIAVLTYAGVTLLRPRSQKHERGPDQEPVTLDASPNGNGATVKTALEAARFGLTPRERELLPLLAQRLTDREIAERLCISYRTAEGHSRSILAKLELTSRREVADFCEKHGLLPPSIPPLAAGE